MQAAPPAHLGLEGTMSDYYPTSTPTTDDPHGDEFSVQSAFGDEVEHEELNDSDDVEDSNDVDETSDDSGDTESASGRSNKSGLTKASARRAIDKAFEIQAATEDQQLLLAAVLGTRVDVADMAATIVSSGRTNLSALNELAQIAESATANPFEGVVAAMSLSRENRKRVWALLTQLNQVEGGIPSKESTAAAKIAEAATSLSSTAFASLDAVRTLGRK